MMEQVTRGQSERLQFIEDMLFWVGTICNSDVRRRFDVAKSLAAQDIARYRQMQPASVLYEPQIKSFIAPEILPPLLAPQSFERFVRLVQVDELAAGEVLDIAFLHPPARPAPLGIARSVVGAIFRKEEIEVDYVSFSSGSARRWLTPHALAGDGLRFHVRAFDHSKGRFADFVMGRIQRVRRKRPRSVDVDADTDWMHVVEVELIANPALPEDRRQAVMAEYEFDGDVLVHRIRKAMLIYLNSRMLLHSELAGMPQAELYRPLVPRDQAAFDRLFDDIRSRHEPADTAR